MPSLSDPLPLPPGDFRAFLFDLDGTVADSMPLHYRAWSTIFAQHGGEFPLDLFYSWGGIPLPKTVEMYNELYGFHLDPIETTRKKEELYLSQIASMKPIESVLFHVLEAHGRIPLAIVSGSPRASIFRTLSTLGLADRFETIVGAEDYTHGKPSPEPFLTAATRLNIAPEHCLVFEDADAGIASAQAAGMPWVRVPQPPFTS
jgi:HAD superfamily hydrolase (TIGR01509 family)